MRLTHWERYSLTREKRAWTPLRLKAAERAVKKEADAMPLFPELRRVQTVEERIVKMDNREDVITKRLRDWKAQTWRKARAYLRTLSASERERLLAKWNTRFMPGCPSNLLTLARMMRINPLPD